MQNVVVAQEIEDGKFSSAKSVPGAHDLPE
jgi:hypothetical protein